MIRKFLLCYCLAFSVFSTTKAQNIDSLSIVSWNIQMLPDFFSPFSSSLRAMQAKRVPWIVEYVKAQNFDVVVFQEVFDLDCKKRLSRLLSDLYPYQIAPINHKRFTSNGIWIVSKYPMQKLGHVVYAKGIGSDKMAAKGAVLAEIKIAEDWTIQVLGTHLQSGNREEAQLQRNQQYKAMRGLLDQYRRDGVLQLVVGDMNTRKSETQRYSLMLSELDVQDYPLNEEEPFTIDNKNYWKSPKHEAVQLDYIFIRQNGTTADISYLNVLRPKKEHKGRAIDLADHYGVKAILRKKP